jgi:hypothetical protein
MLRKSLAILLLFFWVILSAIDLLEDLEFDSEASAYNNSPTDDSPPNSTHRAPLANNIVESADHAQLFYPALLRLTAAQSPIHPVLSFQKVSQLHKLHRVFLI